DSPPGRGRQAAQENGYEDCDTGFAQFLCSSDPFALFAPESLAQQVLLDLSGCGARQGGHEVDPLRTLVMCKVFAAESDQIGFAGLLPGLEHNESVRDLAPALVGSRNNGCLEHRGVFVQEAFDFEGGDILSPGYDQVFFAIDDFNKAFA